MAAKPEKEAVTCLVVVDGKITKRVPEHRRVYESRGARFVRSMNRKLPLSPSNEYRFEWTSIRSSNLLKDLCNGC